MKKKLFDWFQIVFLGLLFSYPCFSEPPNLGKLKIELIHYSDSGAYAQELEQKIKIAKQYIIEQALLNQKSNHPQKLALVLDIDETSLSNYDKIEKRGFCGTQKQIHQEIQKADAPVIRSTLDLYNSALQHGIKVFFISGRFESERQATAFNLKKAGFAHWSGLYLRPMNYSQKSIIPFKSGQRAQITQHGYTVIASIGDQFSDLKGGYANKTFKLPNPFYYLP